MSSRFQCILWRETAAEVEERGQMRVEIVRSRETLHVATATLGSLFEAIRDNAPLLKEDN